MNQTCSPNLINFNRVTFKISVEIDIKLSFFNVNIEHIKTTQNHPKPFQNHPKSFKTSSKPTTTTPNHFKITQNHSKSLKPIQNNLKMSNFGLKLAQVGSTWVQVGQVGSLLEAPGPPKTKETHWFFIIFQNPIFGIVWTQVGSMLAQLGPS